MSHHHSDQMSQRSQVSGIALLRCSLNVFVFVMVIVSVFVFVFVIVFILSGNVSSSLWSNVTVGHKSLGSLCSVVKTLIVSGARPSKGLGHLLSCSGQLKKRKHCNLSLLLLLLVCIAINELNCTTIDTQQISFGDHMSTWVLQSLQCSGATDAYCNHRISLQ